MSNGIIVRLRNALDRIELIGTLTEGRSCADASRDRRFQLGLELQLGRLGSTLGKVLAQDPALVEVLPLAPAVVETGESILRDYDSLDHAALWKMAVHDLPSLAHQIERAIATYIETSLPVEGRGELVPLVDAKRHELIALCREYGVYKMLVFGSAVKGTFDPERSDLDFAVDLGDSEPGVSRRYMNLIVALEDLFGRSVDVVTLHDGLSERFRHELNQTAMTIFEQEQSIAG